jgi:excisionase family DNA binding protein
VQDELMTPAELAGFLKVPVSRVYAMTHRHEVPFIKLSHRCLRFSRAEVKDWLQKKREPEGETEHDSHS